jgi:hypothetical protein
LTDADPASADWSRENEAYLTHAIAKLKAAMRGEDAPSDLADMHAFSLRAPALENISAAFELTPFERNLLLLCAAIELDPAITAICTEAPGGIGKPYPTFSLAFSVFPGAHWSALGPQAPLRRWKLIDVAEGQPLTQAPLRIDEAVLHYLTGSGELDRRLAAVLLPLPLRNIASLEPSHVVHAHQIAAAWEASAGTGAALVQLIGEPADCRQIVAAAANLIGMHTAVLAADHVPSTVDELETLLRLWKREICFSGFGVLLVERDELAEAEDSRAQARGLARLLERLPGPAALCEREQSRLGHRSVATIVVGRLPTAEQRHAWHEALTDAAGERFESPDAAAIDIATDRVAAQFSMDRATIETVAVEAVAHASRLKLAPDAIGTVAWDFCRARVRARLDGLAQRVRSTIGWEDLILPEAEMTTLRTIAAQSRQRMTVYERWGFANKSSRGLGISALFSGPSGTGKTMAAEVLANDLQLDLYRIDLASVVSKYIGETEKNLRRVFDAAEQSAAVLLFDEADALFGKRSEVKDSHDRYANIEVSYLLQQMESYRGLAILTSNMKASLDPAFLRRLRFIIQFPFPDASHRLRLWRQTFPPETPVEALDFDKLAELKVTGGNIRSIAMNAAFLAADANEPVGMSHLRDATRIEYAKLERHLTAAETEAWR